MIFKKEKKRLKKVLGGDYSSLVLNELNTKDILNKQGEPYSRGMIRAIFNGERSNKAIEDTIFEVYQKRAKELAIERDRRKEILKLNK